MSKHVVILGAVALGPKVASRLKRVAPDFQVTMLDKDRLISYGGCGIPYYVSGDINDIKELRSTIYHMERNEDFFDKVKHCQVLTGKEVLEIDRQQKLIHFQDVDNQSKDQLEYDYLVLATGSTPIIPNLPGIDLPRVFAVSNLHEATEIKDLLSQGQLESVAVVGAGAIGVEMAEALTDLWGIETTLVEMQDRVLPAALGPEMAWLVQKKLQDNEVQVLTKTQALRIQGDQEHGVTALETTQGNIECQAVIFCIGVRPNTKLARDAGLPLGPQQGILVDSRMRTVDPSIYAGGDCVQQLHLLSGEYIHLPLGSLANRQGRVIGSNIAGGNQKFQGVLGNFCVKVFETGVARAGLTLEQAKGAGFEPVSAIVVQTDRAHFYPTAALMYMQLIADKKTRQVLGVEAVGPNGDAVKARVDAIAVAMSHEADLEEISNLEVSYSPPYASAMDIVNTCANVLQNIMDGLNQSSSPLEFLQAFQEDGCRVLDIRSPDLAQSCTQKYGQKWINIPLSQVKERFQDIPGDQPLFVYCNTGTTAYEVQRYLNTQGLEQAKSVQGSFAMIKQLDPDFESLQTEDQQDRPTQDPAN
ncbi:MAG: FAD-dependent oxidoreductase [Desulfohalobiaceae bacterium]